MAIRLYGDVSDQRPFEDSELGARLGQFARCCRGLECAINDFCAGDDGEAAARLRRLAAGLADQSERLAGALAAAVREPLN